MFNPSKNRNKMTSSEIIKYANANLWYLREGDYLPARLGEMNCGRGVNNIEFLDEMRRLGTRRKLKI